VVKSINKVILLGHLGRDPDPHTTPGGRLVVNFTVATNRARRDPAGNRLDETEWFRVVLWDQLAQTAELYLRKGALIYVEGRLQTRRYVDKDNVERATVEIVAHDFVMLDRRTDLGQPHPAPLPVPTPLRPLPPPLARGPAPRPLAARSAAMQPPPASAPPPLAPQPAPSYSPAPPVPPTASPVAAIFAPPATDEEDYAVYDIDDEHAPF
jgi:single-strand DNA-binding protein